MGAVGGGGMLLYALILGVGVESGEGWGKR